MSNNFKTAIDQARNFINARGSSSTCDGDYAVRIVRGLLDAAESRVKAARVDKETWVLQGLGELLVCIMKDRELILFELRRIADGIEKRNLLLADHNAIQENNRESLDRLSDVLDLEKGREGA